ncbi:hypothetical protein I317_03413 [Kwoniella heveanensis CBS 569]|nr:hypothetical protein I317_03413 [Kwoniella heveanensis CBS 569]
MSMEQTDHASLATLLQYDQGKVPEEADSHGLMEYFQDNYSHTEPAGDVNAENVRAEPSHSTLAPLPGHHAGRPLATSQEGGKSPAVRGSQSHTPHGRDFDASAHANVNAETSPLPAPRSPSPPIPGIPLPNSLVRLASQALSNYDLPNLALMTGQQAIEQASLANELAERGEMGGKRRKEPHQRAGWKEMDEQPQGLKRRRTRKADQNQTQGPGQMRASPQSAIGANGTGSGVAAQGHSQGQGSENDINHLTELSRLAMSGALAHTQGQQNIPVDPTLQDEVASNNTQLKANFALPDQAHSHGTGPAPAHPQERGQDAIASPGQAQVEGHAPEADDTKLSRAEQNKRAQQAFRRRREEHMKKLELDSAQLQILKKHSEQRDLVTKDALFSLEAHKIEIAALREIIRTLMPTSSISPINKEGYFNTGDESPLSRDQVPQGPEVVEGAFEILARQAREVVKLHHIGVGRAGDGEGDQQQQQQQHHGLVGADELGVAGSSTGIRKE